MKLTDILAIVKFVVWLVPEILEIIRKAADIWPKRDPETPEQTAVRQAARQAWADPRIKTKLATVMDREPTSIEIAAVRDVACSVDKKMRRRAGKSRG